MRSSSSDADRRETSGRPALAPVAAAEVSVALACKEALVEATYGMFLKVERGLCIDTILESMRKVVGPQ